MPGYLCKKLSKHLTTDGNFLKVKSQIVAGFLILFFSRCGNWAVTENRKFSWVLKTWRSSIANHRSGTIVLMTEYARSTVVSRCSEALIFECFSVSEELHWFNHYSLNFLNISKVLVTFPSGSCTFCHRDLM